MKKLALHYAFIDGQNVNLSIKRSGWKLDWKKFREYLREKYAVTRAYVFLGFLAQNTELYEFLEDASFILIFKEILEAHAESIKGNCDAELVLETMIEFDHYDQAVIVTGDGDFACLVRYLLAQNKLSILIVPNGNEYSALLNKAAPGRILALDRLKERLSYNK